MTTENPSASSAVETPSLQKDESQSIVPTEKRDIASSGSFCSEDSKEEKRNNRIRKTSSFDSAQEQENQDVNGTKTNQHRIPVNPERLSGCRFLHRMKLIQIKPVANGSKRGARGPNVALHCQVTDPVAGRDHVNILVS